MMRYRELVSDSIKFKLFSKALLLSYLAAPVQRLSLAIVDLVGIKNSVN